MNWGYVLLQNGRATKRVTNVRDDTILKSKFWRGSFEERRCLVPATSFCEPNGDVKPATWHWFAINGSETSADLCFPWHLAALSGTREEGWPEARSRGLCLPHHYAEQLGSDQQP